MAILSSSSKAMLPIFSIATGELFYQVIWSWITVGFVFWVDVITDVLTLIQTGDVKDSQLK